MSRGDVDKNIISLTHNESINNSLNADTSKSIHLKISDEFSGDTAGSESENDFDLGPTPRSKYPLVILVSLHDEDYDTQSHNVSIVSIYVPVCEMEQILYDFYVTLLGLPAQLTNIPMLRHNKE